MPEPGFPDFITPAAGETTEPASAPSARSLPTWRTRARNAVILVVQLVLALVLFMAARSSVADQYLVPTGSMEPTIMPGDRIFVDKMAYDLRLPFSSRVLAERREPERGDLVIFLDPRDEKTTFVKRVVALPGEAVMMRAGILYVNGEPQRLSKRQDGQFIECLGAVVHAAGRRDPESYGPIIVPPGELFLMGDNRLLSYDSRFLGAIPRHLVRGKVLGVVYHYDDEYGGGLNTTRLLRPLD